jgi:DNA polymerase-3 subunit delta
MDFSKFQKTIQAPEPVYLLITDQDYLKKRVYECCLDQVAEEVRAFNWAVYDLDKDSVSELLNTARTLPWMASRRWIYVKNADSAGEKLKEYLQNPSAGTSLVLEAKRKSRNWSKLPTIELPQRTDPLHWVMSKAKREGYDLDARAGEALVELIGENYQQLEAELEKQFLWELESRKITLDSVLRMTRQARQYDVFALIGAIAGRDGDQALHILDRLHDSGMTAPQIISMLYWNFRRVLVAREMLERGKPFRSVLTELKIWSYKDKEREIRKYSPQILTDILIRLRETDRLCKSTSTDPKLHLERVIVDTCGAKFL